MRVRHLLCPPCGERRLKGRVGERAQVLGQRFGSATHDAARLATELKGHGILVKALNDPNLGAGFMRVTTALPKDNDRFVQVLRELL